MSSRLTVHVRPLPNLITFPSKTAAGVPGGRVAEPSTESAVGKFLGPPISAGLTALVTWLSAGATGAVSQAAALLLALLGGICGLSLTLYYRRQLGVLGSSRKVAAERRAYEALRNSLAKGNLAARLYAEGLTRFLDWVDRFVGDAEMADRTLFPHAFGLRKPAPLWTAPAFELCLLLALIYPTATIFIVWAISGHVGPAELALHLDPSLAAWRRSLAAALALVSVFALWAATGREGRGRLIQIIVSIVAFVVAMALSVASARAMTIAGAHPPSSGGYFTKVAAITTEIRIVVSHQAIAIAVVLLGTVSVTAIIGLLGTVLGAIRRSSNIALSAQQGTDVTTW